MQRKASADLTSALTSLERILTGSNKPLLELGNLGEPEYLGPSSICRCAPRSKEDR